MPALVLSFFFLTVDTQRSRTLASDWVTLADTPLKKGLMACIKCSWPDVSCSVKESREHTSTKTTTTCPGSLCERDFDRVEGPLQSAKTGYPEMHAHRFGEVRVNDQPVAVDSYRWHEASVGYNAVLSRDVEQSRLAHT
jgi:hypothetical protein